MCTSYKYMFFTVSQTNMEKWTGLKDDHLSCESPLPLLSQRWEFSQKRTPLLLKSLAANCAKIGSVSL